MDSSHNSETPNDCEVSKDSPSTEQDLDPETARIVRTFTNCVLINFICLFGLIGNSINIAVLRQHGFKETTNIVLVSLSTSDLIFNFLVLISRLKCLLGLFDEAVSVTVHTFATLVSFMPKYVPFATSCAYVVVIAVERFTAVFFPFKVAKYFRRNIMLCIVITLPTLCVVTICPSFFTLGYEWVFDARFNQTVAVIRYTEFYNNNHVFIDMYIWVAMNNLYCATSILIVTSCCLAIGYKLTRAKIKRETMTTKATGYDAKVVKMLMTVCLVYLAVIIPAITMYSYFRPNFIITSEMGYLMDDVGVILHSTNASMNFLVYVTMSEKFAATYRRLLMCKSEPKNPLRKPRMRVSR